MDSGNGSDVKCMICLSTLVPGRGQAMYTAECGHSFHFSCITSNIKHGNELCPTCRCEWNDLPSILPQVTSPPPPLPIYPTPPYVIPSSHQEPQIFCDDDPVLLPITTTNPDSDHQRITLQSHTEYPSLLASESSSTFAVLVRTIAPPISSQHQDGRAPLDLVLVLDVSGSMRGRKLNLLKQAVTFVIENLGRHDRLSIVTFSTTARRVYPLRRMSDLGKERAITVVNSLTDEGTTDILAGLHKGIRVLHERRERNPVASVVLLSDGQDNASEVVGGNRRTASIISAAAEAAGGGICNCVHTFGFGSDHDPTLLHGLANRMDGTFSFIESVEIIDEAFARCIGGLLSVVAQDVKITMRSPEGSMPPSNGVKIVKILAGRYGSEVRNGGMDGVINVGMLYADEEKKFLIYLNVPSMILNEKEEETTKLLDLKCEYKEPTQEEIITVEGETVKIRRPSVLSSSEATLADPLVIREKNRLEMVEDIGRAHSMGEEGDLASARSLLERRSELLRVAGERDGHANYDYASLEDEMVEMTRRMGSTEIYRSEGRAYALSGMSAHGWQRATTRGSMVAMEPRLVERMAYSSAPAECAYDTPGISKMVMKSKTKRSS